MDGHLWLAAVLAACGLLLAALELAIYFSHPPLGYRADQAAVELWQYVTQGPALVIAGLLVLARRSVRTVGWLLLGPAVAFMIAACLSTWLRFTTAISPGVEPAMFAEYVLWEVPRVALVVLPLCFPHGHLPRGRALKAAAVLVTVVLAHETLTLVGQRDWLPGTLAVSNAVYVRALAPLAAALDHPLEAIVAVLAILAALSPLTMWKMATAVQRRQITVMVPIFVLQLVEEIVRVVFGFSPVVVGAKVTLGVLAPAALAYTVLRDRLYDIDRAARRVIGVAVPAVLLAAVYAVAAALMSVLLPPRVGAAVPAVLAVLAALVGLLLRPAARWVQHHVDRLLYGDRAEPYELARRLAGTLREGADAAQMPLAVCQIVVSALRLPAAELVDGQHRPLARVGERAAALEPIPLRYQGAVVGQLLVAPRSGEAVLDELDRAALQPLADLAAPAVSAILLGEELASSRARLASAHEEERGRIRRDVHDGVGPTLAAVRLQVDTAAALLPSGSPSGALLARVSEELGNAVAEIRRVTENQRPPVLEARGLASALDELTSQLSTPVMAVGLELPAVLPPAGPAVELAAYRITAEALANAIKHSGARRATVSVSADGHCLTIRIADDGAWADGRGDGTGVGLASMTRRAADAGGTCVVTGGPTGTVVTATLPSRVTGAVSRV